MAKSKKVWFSLKEAVCELSKVLDNTQLLRAAVTNRSSKEARLVRMAAKSNGILVSAIYKGLDNVEIKFNEYFEIVQVRKPII